MLFVEAKLAKRGLICRVTDGLRLLMWLMAGVLVTAILLYAAMFVQQSMLVFPLLKLLA